MREHDQSTKQIFSAVQATTCDPFMTVEATRQELHVFRGEAGLKVDKPSKVVSPSVAGSEPCDTGEMYDEDSNDGDWDLNDANFICGGVNTVHAREVQVSFTKV